MKRATCTAAILLAATHVALADGATVEGRVELPRPAAPGALPPRYENVPAALIGRPPPPVAVVFLEGDFPAAPPATNAVLAQHHLQFAESVLPVQAGTTVEFPNHDRLFHNVFSYSKPKRFDLGRYTAGERPPPQVFDRPGVVRLNCEIHPHMRATVLVLATPHFTRTDTNGAFRLTGLPAGRWTLRTWVEEKDVREQTVELTEGAVLKVNFPAP